MTPLLLKSGESGEIMVNSFQDDQSQSNDDNQQNSVDEVKENVIDGSEKDNQHLNFAEVDSITTSNEFAAVDITDEKGDLNAENPNFNCVDDQNRVDHEKEGKSLSDEDSTHNVIKDDANHQEDFENNHPTAQVDGGNFSDATDTMTSSTSNNGSLLNNRSTPMNYSQPEQHEGAPTGQPIFSAAKEFLSIERKKQEEELNGELQGNADDSSLVSGDPLTSSDNRPAVDIHEIVEDVAPRDDMDENAGSLMRDTIEDDDLLNDTSSSRTNSNSSRGVVNSINSSLNNLPPEQREENPTGQPIFFAAQEFLSAEKKNMDGESDLVQQEPEQDGESCETMKSEDSVSLSNDTNQNAIVESNNYTIMGCEDDGASNITLNESVDLHEREEKKDHRALNINVTESHNETPPSIDQQNEKLMSMSNNSDANSTKIDNNDCEVTSETIVPSRNNSTTSNDSHTLTTVIKNNTNNTSSSTIKPQNETKNSKSNSKNGTNETSSVARDGSKPLKINIEENTTVTSTFNNASRNSSKSNSSKSADYTQTPKNIVNNTTKSGWSDNQSIDDSSSTSNISTRIRSAAECLNALKFSDFQARMRAKFDTAGGSQQQNNVSGNSNNSNSNNNGPLMPPNSPDVFRSLMQKIISLEQNSRILELYTVQVQYF